MKAVLTLRILAGVCVALAVICVGLAWAYHQKTELADCLRESIDLGLAGGACR